MIDWPYHAISWKEWYDWSVGGSLIWLWSAWVFELEAVVIE